VRKGQTTKGAAASAKAQSDRPQPDVELGHHLPTHHHARDLVVPLPGDPFLESRGRRMGCRRAGSPCDRCRSGKQSLTAREDQQGPKASVDPPC